MPRNPAGLSEVERTRKELSRQKLGERYHDTYSVSPKVRSLPALKDYDIQIMNRSFVYDGERSGLLAGLNWESGISHLPNSDLEHTAGQIARVTTLEKAHVHAILLKTIGTLKGIYAASNRGWTSGFQLAPHASDPKKALMIVNMHGYGDFEGQVRRMVISLHPSANPAAHSLGNLLSATAPKGTSVQTFTFEGQHRGEGYRAREVRIANEKLAAAKAVHTRVLSGLDKIMADARAELERTKYELDRVGAVNRENSAALNRALRRAEALESELSRSRTNETTLSMQKLAFAASIRDLEQIVQAGGKFGSRGGALKNIAAKLKEAHEPI
jgi:hypothetical protein